MSFRLADPSGSSVGRLLAASVIAAGTWASAEPAAALVVSPFFAGHATIDSTTSTNDYSVYDGRLQSIFGQTSIDIDVAHGMVDDGGILGGPATPGDWGFDYDIWAPLTNNMNIALGGEVTYGFPATDVFAVTWVDVANAEGTTIRNTFQVVFIGTSGFHTNMGIAIAPGSVIFAYGAAGDPSGTVHLSASSPAAIGILLPAGLTTLASFGIGDANGVLTTADVAALQNSGDPFLFNKGPYGLESPVAFDSIQETLPEPAPAWLVGVGLAECFDLARRTSARSKGASRGGSGATRT
jgi:hypothetical protein